MISIHWDILFFFIFCCDLGYSDENEVESLHSDHKILHIPDLSAHTGNLFVFQVPHAHGGKISRYSALYETGEPLSPWLIFNEKNGLFEGVPGEKDLGQYYITIKAFDHNYHCVLKGHFALEVLPGLQIYGAESEDTCAPQDDKTVIITVLEADYNSLNSTDHIRILKRFADTIGISPLSLKISEQEHNDDILSDSVLAAGPGNAKRIYNDIKSSVVLHWQVGCNGNLWADSINKLEIVKNVTKGGKLSANLGYPVIGWRLIKDESRRLRREVFKSEEVSNGIEEDYSVPERAIIKDSATPFFGPELSPTIPAPTPIATLRHHRHNHGYASQSETHRLYRSIVSDIFVDPSATELELQMSSSLTSEEGIDYNREIQPSLTVISPSPSVSVNTQGTDITDAENEDWPSVDESVTEGSTPPMPHVPHFVNSFDEISYETKNTAPEIVNRVQKLHVTAGKLLRHKLPENTFRDREDGLSRNLTLTFQTSEGQPIPENSWIQFDDKSQEIYGLPLEEHVSKWSYILTATDSGSLSVEDNIEVTVQHHKGRRTVTHAIIIEVLNVPPGPIINWQILLLESIREVLPDQEGKSIVVLSVNVSSLPYTFVWTNDTLPRSSCPREEIESIVKELSSKLKNHLKGGLKIGNIKWVGKGHCEARIPEAPVPSNSPPVMRNQVDHLNATVGQLLVYTVPFDTFFDQDDGHSRNLRLSLLTMDMRPISKTNWLQFDDKNQEFFGIPMATHVGQMEYLLQCEDSGGLRISDSLVVTVHPAPKTLYNVEFSIKLKVDYQGFVESPSMQRDFVQRLAALFGDENTNAIVLSGLSPGSTVITWHNKTLPTSICPDHQILQLRQIMLHDDERVTPAVIHVFGHEFPVLSAKLTPTGLCQGYLTKIFVDSGSDNMTTDVTAVSRGEQYIIGLVIPTVVISVMLLCAGLVACILYRRRKTGKMSVGDEDEKQSFRSKGIPVIFQDELDERPEPSNKSPVIMKEEKPPLPPPEYQRGPPLATTALLSDTEDTPYQPPPPFTSSRDSARPKPTPTYRMPPPYVPP